MILEEMEFFKNINTIKVIYPMKDSVYFHRPAGFPKRIRKAKVVEHKYRYFLMFEGQYTNFVYFEEDKFMVIDNFDRLNIHWNDILK